MLISKHAIRRYRQRIGSKHMNTKRVKKRIQEALAEHVMRRHYCSKTSSHIIVTDHFIAVIANHIVVTVFPLDSMSKAETYVGSAEAILEASSVGDEIVGL